MDFEEAAKILFRRIKLFETEHASKIMNYLLAQNYSEQRMIELAFCREVELRKIILKFKIELQQLQLKNSLYTKPLNYPTLSYFSSSEFSQHLFGQHSSAFSAPSKHNADFSPFGYVDSTFSELHPSQLFEDYTDLSNNYLYSDELANLSRRATSQYMSTNEVNPMKPCYFFKKGHCKNGNNCKYFHGRVSENFLPNIDSITEDQSFLPGSLETLELEIIELLKSRKGNPVSIASLPMIYYERYGKVLQAEGYLTESQRQGKPGFTLTKLLARLKNSVRLIDRPHGQHSVILAEDAARYMENRSERNDPGPIVSGSKQIYLTFPAECTFTDKEVSEYFSQFGPVEDVRIPCQERRMFGFVSFESADTVKTVLAKGNPHYVCGCRVLVKPYREKPKYFDRKYQESINTSVYVPPHHVDMVYPPRQVDTDVEFPSWGNENHMLWRKQAMEQNEQELELQRRLSGLHIWPQPVTSQLSRGYAISGLKDSEESFNFPPAKHFSRQPLDVINDGKENDHNCRDTDNGNGNKDSGLKLPDDLFGYEDLTPFSQFRLQES